jgi:hypothetical protein
MADMTITDERPLLPFAELRYRAQHSPLAHACITLRKQQVCSAGWDIRVRGETSPAARQRRSEALEWFQRPDSAYWSFSEWLGTAARDVLTTDSLAVCLRRTRGEGCGLLGSDLYEMQLVDGATILPTVKKNGSAAEYRQYPWAVRRQSFGDLAAGPAGDAGEAMGTYSDRMLLYCPWRRRPWTPFGFSPLEEALQGAGIDGEVDDISLLNAFGIDPEALGIIGGEPLGDDAPRNLDRDIRRWFKGIFDSILHRTCSAPNLEWLWLDEDGKPER